jgi:O26-antigen biosynthesis N-acetyl-L-fucosamine transferase
MRIAIMVDAAMPLDTRNHGRMMHQLAEEFALRGHEVAIITPSTEKQKLPLKVDVIGAVEIWRFRSGNIRAVSTERLFGLILRTLNEWLIGWRGWYAISSRVRKEPFDLCVIHSPSIFFGGLAKKLKNEGAFVYVVLRDMFPQWAVDQGLIKKKSLIEYFFRHYEKLIYRVSDCIGVMSKNNITVLKDKNQSLKNVKVLMNWIDNKPLDKKLKSTKFFENLNLKDKVILFYGGNIGNAQDMTNIMRLAKNLLDTPKAHLLIVGQGDEYNLIIKLRNRWNLHNVTILPSISQGEFRKVLCSIDIGLFSLSANHKTHNFPGKVLGYMVESIPILGSVNPGNDLMDMVNNSKSGAVHINGEDDLLLNSAKSLIEDVKLRRKLGLNAKALLGKYFSVTAAVDSILKECLPKLEEYPKIKK